MRRSRIVSIGKASKFSIAVAPGRLRPQAQRRVIVAGNGRIGKPLGFAPFTPAQTLIPRAFARWRAHFPSYRGMKRRKKVAPGHDAGYKRLFSHPGLVEELLRGFLDGDWIDQLDFSSLEKVVNSFVSDDLRERHSDLIWRVRFKGEEGDWVYIYLLLEFQSTSDPFIAVRLLTYVGLLLEEIIQRESLKPGDRLPAVLPLVLYNGKGRWRGPLRLEDLFAPVPRALRRYLPRLTYRLLDERRLDLDLPELQRNQTAALFRIEINEAPEALPGLSQALDGLLPAGDSALRRTINTWFRSVVRRTYPDAIIPVGMNLEEAPMLEET